MTFDICYSAWDCLLLGRIISNLSGPAKAFYEREFDFFNKVTAISGEIRPFPRGPERNRACLEALAKIQAQKGQGSLLI